MALKVLILSADKGRHSLPTLLSITIGEITPLRD